MSRASKDAQREAFDRKVLKHITDRQTTNVNRVARHFQVKWETAERSLKRLQAEGLVFFHPDMRLWSIWSDNKFLRCFSPSQQAENGNFVGEPTTSTFVSSLSGLSIVRGAVGETIEKEGFLCHPKTKGRDVPRTFVRAHFNGQYVVEIVKAGRMPETFVLPDGQTTGDWTSRKMNGNDCCFGRLNFADDDKTYKFHTMTDKKCEVHKLSVYVHPRYIYYRNSEEVASVEFRQQVKDVLNVLETHFGWKFGTITPKGVYHAALNDPVLASHMPINHTESDTDAIHYDASVKDGDGVCTEAEVYFDHPTAKEEAELMVELPSRFINLERRADQINTRIGGVEQSIDVLTRILEKSMDQTDRIVGSIEELHRATEFNTSILLGNQSIPTDGKLPYMAHHYKGDVMYG